MARDQEYQELEYELALTGVLEDIFDLAVRSGRDPLNRRKSGYATLDFKYQYDESDQVKVVVSISGVEGASFALEADFSNPDTIAASAEACEELALVVRSHLGDTGAVDSGFDRRFDDLY